MKFLKIGNDIINLAQVTQISLFNIKGKQRVTFYGNSVIDQSTVLWFYEGDEAAYVWEFINEHLDMTVCPILQGVTK